MSLLFVCIAAMCNAMMDTLSHHYYMFRWNDKTNNQWWNANISWSNKDNPKYNKFGVWFSDAWHLFKSTMIVMLAAAICFGIPDGSIFSWLLWFAACGIVWNLTFNLFYNRLLIKK